MLTVLTNLSVDQSLLRCRIYPSFAISIQNNSNLTLHLVVSELVSAIVELWTQRVTLKTGDTSDSLAGVGWLSGSATETLSPFAKVVLFYNLQKQGTFD